MYRYKVIILCKSMSINHANRFNLLIFHMTSAEIDAFTESMALQGHDLKNIAFWSPESKKLRTFNTYEQYGFTEAESEYRMHLDDLPTDVEYWKEFFNIHHTKTEMEKMMEGK
jgi:hypothetical protein